MAGFKSLFLTASLISSATGLVAEMDGKTEKYLEIVKKRPESDYLFEKFYYAWLVNDSASALETFLAQRAEADPSGPWLLLQAKFYNAQHENEQALALYKKLTEGQNASPDIYLEKALIHKKFLQYEAAVQDLEAALSLKPRGKVAIRLRKELGILYIRTQQEDKAEAVWQPLVDDSDVTLSEEVVDLRIRENQFTAAEAHLLALTERVTDAYAKVRLNLKLADLYFRQNRKEQAEACYLRTLGQVGTNSWLTKEIYSQLENLYKSDDNLHGLAKFYQELLSERSNDAELLRRLSIVQYQCGEEEKCIENLELLVKITPGDEDNMLTLIQYYREAGKLPQAVSQLDHLLAADTDRQDLLLLKAEILLADQKMTEANSIFSQLMEITTEPVETGLGVVTLLRMASKGETALSFIQSHEVLNDSTLVVEAQCGILDDLKRQEEALALRKELITRVDLTAFLRLLDQLKGLESKEILTFFEARQDLSGDYLYHQKYFRQLQACQVEEPSLYEAQILGMLSSTTMFQEINVAANLLLDHYRKYAGLDQLVQNLEQIDSEANRLFTEALLKVETEDIFHAIEFLQSNESQAPELLSDLCLALMKRSQLNHDYIQYLETLVGRYPARRFKYYEKLVSECISQGAISLADKWLNEWYKFAPTSTTPYFQEVSLANETGDVQRKLKVLQRAVIKFPDTSDFVLALANHYASAGDHLSAFATLWQAIGTKQDLKEKLSLTHSLLKIASDSNNLDKIEQELKERRDNNPKNLYPLMALSALEELRYDNLASRNYLMAASRLKPNDLNLLLEIAGLDLEEGNYELVRQNLEQLDNKYTDHRLKDLLVSVYTQTGNISELSKLMRVEFESKATDLDKKINKLSTFTSLYPSEAMVLLKELGPEINDPRFSFYLGTELLKSGEKENALQIFRHLLISQPDYPELAKRLSTSSSQMPAYSYGSRQPFDQLVGRDFGQIFSIIQQAASLAHTYNRQNRHNYHFYGQVSTNYPLTKEAFDSQLLQHLLYLSAAIPDYSLMTDAQYLDEPFRSKVEYMEAFVSFSAPGGSPRNYSNNDISQLVNIAEVHAPEFVLPIQILYNIHGGGELSEEEWFKLYQEQQSELSATAEFQIFQYLDLEKRPELLARGIELLEDESLEINFFVQNFIRSHVFGEGYSGSELQEKVTPLLQRLAKNYKQKSQGTNQVPLGQDVEFTLLVEFYKFSEDHNLLYQLLNSRLTGLAQSKPVHPVIQPHAYHGGWGSPYPAQQKLINAFNLSSLHQQLMAGLETFNLEPALATTLLSLCDEQTDPLLKLYLLKQSEKQSETETYLMSLLKTSPDNEFYLGFAVDWLNSQQKNDALVQLFSDQLDVIKASKTRKKYQGHLLFYLKEMEDRKEQTLATVQGLLKTNLSLAEKGELALILDDLGDEVTAKRLDEEIRQAMKQANQGGSFHSGHRSSRHGRRSLRDQFSDYLEKSEKMALNFAKSQFRSYCSRKLHNRQSAHNNQDWEMERVMEQIRQAGLNDQMLDLLSKEESTNGWHLLHRAMAAEMFEQYVDAQKYFLKARTYLPENRLVQEKVESIVLAQKLQNSTLADGGFEGLEVTFDQICLLLNQRTIQNLNGEARFFLIEQFCNLHPEEIEPTEAINLGEVFEILCRDQNFRLGQLYNWMDLDSLKHQLEENEALQSLQEKREVLGGKLLAIQGQHLAAYYSFYPRLSVLQGLNPEKYHQQLVAQAIECLNQGYQVNTQGSHGYNSVTFYLHGPYDYLKENFTAETDLSALNIEKLPEHQRLGLSQLVESVSLSDEAFSMKARPELFEHHEQFQMYLKAAILREKYDIVQDLLALYLTSDQVEKSAKLNSDQFTPIIKSLPDAVKDAVLANFLAYHLQMVKDAVVAHLADHPKVTLTQNNLHVVGIHLYGVTNLISLCFSEATDQQFILDALNDQQLQDIGFFQYGNIGWSLREYPRNNIVEWWEKQPIFKDLATFDVVELPACFGVNESLLSKVMNKRHYQFMHDLKKKISEKSEKTFGEALVLVILEDNSTTREQKFHTFLEEYEAAVQALPQEAQARICRQLKNFNHQFLGILLADDTSFWGKALKLSPQSIEAAIKPIVEYDEKNGFNWNQRDQFRMIIKSALKIDAERTIEALIDLHQRVSTYALRVHQNEDTSIISLVENVANQLGDQDVETLKALLGFFGRVNEGKHWMSIYRSRNCFNNWVRATYNTFVGNELTKETAGGQTLMAVYDFMKSLKSEGDFLGFVDLRNVRTLNEPSRTFVTKKLEGEEDCALKREAQLIVDYSVSRNHNAETAAATEALIEASIFDAQLSVEYKLQLLNHLFYVRNLPFSKKLITRYALLADGLNREMRAELHRTTERIIKHSVKLEWNEPGDAGTIKLLISLWQSFYQVNNNNEPDADERIAVMKLCLTVLDKAEWQMVLNSNQLKLKKYPETYVYLAGAGEAQMATELLRANWSSIVTHSRRFDLPEITTDLTNYDTEEFKCSEWITAFSLMIKRNSSAREKILTHLERLDQLPADQQKLMLEVGLMALHDKAPYKFLQQFFVGYKGQPWQSKFNDLYRVYLGYALMKSPDAVASDLEQMISIIRSGRNEYSARQTFEGVAEHFSISFNSDESLTYGQYKMLLMGACSGNVRNHYIEDLFWCTYLRAIVEDQSADFNTSFEFLMKSKQAPWGSQYQARRHVDRLVQSGYEGGNLQGIYQFLNRLSEDKLYQENVPKKGEFDRKVIQHVTKIKELSENSICGRLLSDQTLQDEVKANPYVLHQMLLKELTANKVTDPTQLIFSFKILKQLGLHEVAMPLGRAWHSLVDRASYHTKRKFLEWYQNSENPGSLATEVYGILAIHQNYTEQPAADVKVLTDHYLTMVNQFDYTSEAGTTYLNIIADYLYDHLEQHRVVQPLLKKMLETKEDQLAATLPGFMAICKSLKISPDRDNYGFNDALWPLILKTYEHFETVETVDQVTLNEGCATLILSIYLRLNQQEEALAYFKKHQTLLSQQQETIAVIGHFAQNNQIVADILPKVAETCLLPTADDTFTFKKSDVEDVLKQWEERQLHSTLRYALAVNLLHGKLYKKYWWQASNNQSELKGLAAEFTNQEFVDQTIKGQLLKLYAMDINNCPDLLEIIGDYFGTLELDDPVFKGTEAARFGYLLYMRNLLFKNQSQALNVAFDQKLGQKMDQQMAKKVKDIFYYNLAIDLQTGRNLKKENLPAYRTALMQRLKLSDSTTVSGDMVTAVVLNHFVEPAQQTTMDTQQLLKEYTVNGLTKMELKNYVDQVISTLAQVEISKELDLDQLVNSEALKPLLKQ